MPKSNNIKILIAALNWGLGHATRCMPIINALLAHNEATTSDKKIEIIIASDGRSLQLLQEEYPQLESISLPSYNITYDSRPFYFERDMFLQIPKIFYKIYREHQVVQKIIDEQQIDIILSDNRFGCWSKKAYCIYLTHQIFVQLPSFMRFLERPLLALNKWFIKKYNLCWIPDYPDKAQSLSGNLAHQQALNPKHFRFIGALSRMKKENIFSKKTDKLSKNKKLNTKYDLLIVLSGPEPQRSFFEAEIIEQAKKISLKTLIVRGVTETENWQPINEFINITNFLTANDLNSVLLGAKVVVARAGYSTIMDLVSLQKTAILVPTPRQTEQEYLGNYFMEKKLFYSVKQSEFNLSKALKEIDQFGKNWASFETDLLSIELKKIITL